MKLQNLKVATAKSPFFTVLALIAFNINYGQVVSEKALINGVDISQTINNSVNPESSKSICDTVFSFKTRQYPNGLTWDGQNFWYCNNMINKYIYKVSPSGVHLDSIAKTVAGSDMMYDGINLWLADEQTARLFKMNPTNGTVLQQFNLPSSGDDDPNGWGLAWDGNNIWHSQYLPPRLYKLNPTNASATVSLTTTRGLLGIEWIKGSLYGIGGLTIGTNNFNIFRIDVNTGVFQDSSVWCIPQPRGLTWDGSSLWNVRGAISDGGRQKIYKLNTALALSINEPSKRNKEVEIFPNPATLSISIRGEHIETIEIYNVAGEMIYSKINVKQQIFTEIDLSDIPKGIYFAKIYVGMEICNRKIIIQ